MAAGDGRGFRGLRDRAVAREEVVRAGAEQRDIDRSDSLEGRLSWAVTPGVNRFPPDGLSVYTWRSTGPALAGATITSIDIVGSRNSFENGIVSALRAGCEFTSIEVITSTAMPNTNSPPTVQRR